MSPTDITEELDFIIQLLSQTATIARRDFRSDISHEMKSDETPVTHADKEIERIIRGSIKKNYPDHGIIGEEYSDHNVDSPFQWVIDPIDGTAGFMAGIPLFCTLIALYYHDQPLLGVIHQPISDELWYATHGNGAYYRPKSQNPNEETKLFLKHKDKALSQAIICTTAPIYMEKAGKLREFTLLQNQVLSTRFGLDSYAAGLVAGGQVDIMIEIGLKFYDYAAPLLVIKEAGGIVSDWQGNPLSLSSRHTNKAGAFLATNSEELHSIVLEIMN